MYLHTYKTLSGPFKSNLFIYTQNCYNSRPNCYNLQIILYTDSGILTDPVIFKCRYNYFQLYLKAW